MYRVIVSICILLLFASKISLAQSPIGVPDLEEIEYPDDEPPSTDLVHLGKVLFFDKRLSLNDQQSCATCHNPDLGFGDGVDLSFGTMGNRVGRNSPHLYNLAWNVVFFWDGRASSLEEQALAPIASTEEMNLPLPILVSKLKKVPYYSREFQRIFPDDGITKENISIALAAFQRTIIVQNTPFDRYMKGDLSAMSPAAIRGMKLFEGKARCNVCHMGPNFTDNGFHNIGIGDADIGRQAIQKGVTNYGAFKTPGLRNIILTAPYMHDGSMGTLEEVMRHYNKGGLKVKGLDSLMQPLHLTEKEIYDVIAFMGSLTEHLEIKRPQIP